MVRAGGNESDAVGTLGKLTRTLYFIGGTIEGNSVGRSISRLPGDLLSTRNGSCVVSANIPRKGGVCVGAKTSCEKEG